MGRRGIIFIEPLISEIFYKNIPTFGITKMKDQIYGLKSYDKVQIYKLKENDAIAAGEIKYKYN